MNQTESFNKKTFLQSIIFFLILILLAGGMAVYVISDPEFEQALDMIAVAMEIDKIYPENINRHDLITAGQEAMFENLDRYSTYYKKSQFANLDEEINGSYAGIGISVVRNPDGLLIMSVRENGPAAEVGLLSGDIITAADSISFENLKSNEAINIIKGKEGTKVLLTVKRPVTNETFQVKVTRRQIPFVHIPYAGFTSDSIVYIRILDFEAGISHDLKNALDSLLSIHHNKAQGIILDLRNNPGGFFREAYKCADLFLNKGTFIVGTEGRSRWNDKKYYATGKDITKELPIAIIVNHGTASSAEILSGSLQKANRAFLVGDTTFGKGLVQGFFRFPDGDGVKLTISRYYFKGPVFLNDFDSTLNDVGHGLVPDYYYNYDYLNRFRMELENSFILRQFADLHQGEIIKVTQNDTLDDKWVDKLKKYAHQKQFSFQSLKTLYALEMKYLAQQKKHDKNMTNLAEKIIRLSHKEDNRLFDINKGYIKTKIMQLAYERKYGTYLTYQKVLTKNTPVIKFASQILLNKKND